MSWNHRIIKHGPEDYRLHEVFYDDDGHIEMWTEDAVGVSGASQGEVLSLLRQMVKDAKQQSVVDLKELKASIAARPGRKR